MKLSKEMLQEIADSELKLHDYILFQEDEDAVFVPEFERDNVEEVDGCKVIIAENTKIYNLSTLLDNIGIEEPKTGDEYIVVLNALVSKIESINLNEGGK